MPHWLGRLVFHPEWSGCGASIPICCIQVEWWNLAAWLKDMLKGKGILHCLVATLLSCRKMDTGYLPKVWRLFAGWCAESAFVLCSPMAVLVFLQSGADKRLALIALKGRLSALCVPGKAASKRSMDSQVLNFRQMEPPSPCKISSRCCRPSLRSPLSCWSLVHLKLVTLKAVFLVVITTAGRVGEL